MKYRFLKTLLTPTFTYVFCLKTTKIEVLTEVSKLNRLFHVSLREAGRRLGAARPMLKTAHRRRTYPIPLSYLPRTRKSSRRLTLTTFRLSSLNIHL